MAPLVTPRIVEHVNTSITVTPRIVEQVNTSITVTPRIVEHVNTSITVTSRECEATDLWCSAPELIADQHDNEQLAFVAGRRYFYDARVSGRFLL